MTDATTVPLYPTHHVAICAGCNRPEPIACPHDPAVAGYHDTFEVLADELGRLGWFLLLECQQGALPNAQTPRAYCSLMCVADDAHDRADQVDGQIVDDDQADTATIAAIHHDEWRVHDELCDGRHDTGTTPCNDDLRNTPLGRALAPDGVAETQDLTDVAGQLDGK